MMHACPDSATGGAPATCPVIAMRDGELQRQLHHALESLAASRLRCGQLEAQLQAGHRREHQQRHLAEHDDLTGLFNRAAFRTRVQQALAEDNRVAVLMLDLDGFKQVNDNHGHAAGDEVLRIMAARIGHALRSGDGVGRLGGDEFACLLRNVDGREQLEVLARKLAMSIASPMHVAEGRVSLLASLGMAVSPTDGNSVDTLLATADAAMYRAKRLRKRQGVTPPCDGHEPVSERTDAVLARP